MSHNFNVNIHKNSRYAMPFLSCCVWWNFEIPQLPSTFVFSYEAMLPDRSRTCIWRFSGVFVYHHPKSIDIFWVLAVRKVTSDTADGWNAANKYLLYLLVQQLVIIVLNDLYNRVPYSLFTLQAEVADILCLKHKKNLSCVQADNYKNDTTQT